MPHFLVEGSYTAEGLRGLAKDKASGREAALKTAASELDHTLLNEHEGLKSPTLEALCVHFAGRLGPQFSDLKRIAVSRPSVGESCSLDLG